jgi:hypothetical protein
VGSTDAIGCTLHDPFSCSFVENTAPIPFLPLETYDHMSLGLALSKMPGTGKQKASHKYKPIYAFHKF